LRVLEIEEVCGWLYECVRANYLLCSVGNWAVFCLIRNQEGSMCECLCLCERENIAKKGCKYMQVFSVCAIAVNRPLPCQVRLHGRSKKHLIKVFILLLEGRWYGVLPGSPFLCWCVVFSLFFLLPLPLCKQSLASNLHLTPIGVKHNIYFPNLYP